MKNTTKNIPSPIGRFIDPLTDFGFKKIFGSESNKDLLIAFLNELFKGRKVIKDLSYNPQENSGPVRHYRKTIFDLTCTAADGEIFILEMQRAEQQFLKDRTVFYIASKLYEQGPKGKKDWNYKLKEVYLIALMDFNFSGTSPEKYLHRVRLAEEETGQTFYNKLGFIFLELPNFSIREKDIKTDLERWLYVLCNMSKLKKIPVILNKRIFQKLFRISEVSNLKKEEYMLYERALMDKWDAYAVKKTAQDKLKAARDELKTAYDELKTAHDELKSVMEAAKKSLQEGKKKGLEEGLEKGKAEVVCNLIRKFGFNDERAADAAGVSIGFVKKIRASMKKKK